MFPRQTKPRPNSFPVNLIRRIDSFIFPPLCIVCDKPRPETDRWLCEACHAAITSSIINRKSCSRCSQNSQMRICTCDIVWEYPFSRIISFTDYTPEIQTIMRHIKYHGKRDLAFYMGFLCSAYLDRDILIAADLVIPVPLHWLRLKKRGYNQAFWFALGLTSGSSVKIDTRLLKRARSTQTQTNLDKSDRRDNVENAFSLPPHARSMIAGKSIILIDDVITTGATTAAAAKALLYGGCSAVTALSLARD